MNSAPGRLPFHLLSSSPAAAIRGLSADVHHPLLDIDHIDRAPRTYLASIGSVFASFGPASQDSGNVSYGLQCDHGRYFIKTTDPDIQAYLDYEARVELLRNAAQLASGCDHPLLPRLYNVIESPDGPMLVYEWVDGELLSLRRNVPGSAQQRFRQLPDDEILAALDAIFDLHAQLTERGWIAVDFYDGSVIYDFASRQLHIVDLDNYRRGPFRNPMGRMFGSSRFMAPEEFELGSRIDERTTLFTMGRTAAVFLSDSTLERAPFRAGNALYEVMVRACHERPAQRYPSMRDFCDAWRSARRA